MSTPAVRLTTDWLCESMVKQRHTQRHVVSARWLQTSFYRRMTLSRHKSAAWIPVAYYFTNKLSDIFCLFISPSGPVRLNPLRQTIIRNIWTLRKKESNYPFYYVYGCLIKDGYCILPVEGYCIVIEVFSIIIYDIALNYAIRDKLSNNYDAPYRRESASLMCLVSYSLFTTV